ncbi:hypothetical protein MHU86_5353 [Fragilaria crotonensis]|nr:hypothetical protein MHU86_15613 [Fragilaria crotonensis]KAI2509105.1 hypothetical protein MHU86_5353 [Fragilaria crotonensis]
MVNSRKAFSAGGQWEHCESRIGNAGVRTLTAQKQQLQLNEAARLKIAGKKSEAHLKTLEKAQTALLKYELDQSSLTEKDWGDVIGAGFSLKRRLSFYSKTSRTRKTR